MHVLHTRTLIHIQESRIEKSYRIKEYLELRTRDTKIS